MFIILVQGKEAKNTNGVVITKEGTWFLVEKDHEGWVPATSSVYFNTSTIYTKEDSFSPNAKTFDSIEDASKFIEKWKGHPWWCIPTKNYRIVEVEPEFRIEKYTIGYKKIK